MDENSPAGKIIQTLVQFKRWWIAPILICTLASIFYALFSSKSFTSRQTLVVRDDLVGTFYKPGRFDSFDSMKSAQETILEIARRPHVLGAAMKSAGPPGWQSESAWLNEESVSTLQGKVQLSAPNGAEFGRTEAVVLTLQGATREHSAALIRCLLDEIEKSLRELRTAQFQSMQLELRQAAEIAESSYRNAARELKEFERNIGVDLSTLISLNDSQAGTNNLQSELANLSIEQRKRWASLEDVKKQIQVLSDASIDPESILQVPQELLQLLPTLASLAKGLNDAVIKNSITKGRYQPQHPQVKEDQRAVNVIKSQIQEKLVDSLDSLKRQLELRQRKYDRITQQINDKKLRLGELSSMRVDYTTLRQEVGKKREVNGKAQESLAEIESLGGAARNVNLISRVDEPQTELYPDGPSNKMIVFGGMFGGLMIGLGLVMFVAPVEPGGLLAKTNDVDSPNRNTASKRKIGTRQSEFNESPSVQPNEFNTSAKLNPNSITSQIQNQKNLQREVKDLLTKPSSQETKRTLGENDQVDSQDIQTTTTSSPKASVQESKARIEESSAEQNDVELLTSATSSSEPMESSTEESVAITPKPVHSTSSDSPMENSSEREIQTKQSVEESGVCGIESSNSSNLTSDEPSENFEEKFKSAIHSLTEVVENPDLDSATLGNPPIEKIQVPEVEQRDSAIDTVQTQPTNTSIGLPVRLLDSADKTSDQSGELNQKSDIDFENLPDQFDSPTSIEPGDFDIATIQEQLRKRTRSIPEKLSQLETSQSDTETDLNQPKISNESKTSADTSGSNSTESISDQTGLPLTTSTSDLGELARHPSDPNSGEKPDSRPAATTVDLRQLKERMIGSSTPEPKPLSEVITPCDVDQSTTPTQNELDRNISELADSIREMCKRQQQKDSDQ